MALLDFLFGRTKPVPTTTTVQQTSKLPEQIAPFVEEVLDEAQQIYGQRREEGFKEFPGETIAPRTAEELAAIEGLRGLVGVQEPYRAEAEQALRATPTQFTADEAQRLMSPYQRAVTDIEKREAQRVFERDVQPALEARAIQQGGGMSGLGTRAGLQAAEAQRNQSQILADIETKGQQRAFEQAYRQFGDETAAQRQRSQDIGQLGTQRFNIGLAEEGLAQQLGQADRAEAQAILADQYAEFIEREQFPETELAQFSSFVNQSPFVQQGTKTTADTKILQPAASMGQQLLGLGLSGLNIYGSGGGFGGGKVNPSGFSFGNIFARRGGGTVNSGLSSLPIINRRTNGSTNPERITGPYTYQNLLKSINRPIETIFGKERPVRKSGAALRDELQKKNRALASLRTKQLGGAQTRLIQQDLARQNEIQKAIVNQKKQLEGLDPFGKATQSAMEKLYGEGVQDKGLVGAINVAIPSYLSSLAESDQSKKKTQAEIDAKQATLAMNALEKKTETENRIAEREALVEEGTLKAEQSVEQKVEDRAQEEYGTEIAILKEKTGIINKLSTAQASRAKNKDNAVTAFNSIVKATEKGFAVTYARSNPNDPNSPMIMYVGNRAVTPESRKAMNEAKEAAYKAYLKEGEGTAGLKAALKKITTLTSKTPTKRKTVTELN